MNKAEEYNSSIFDEILLETNPHEAQKTENRMLLAARIDEGIKAKGWNKGEFATRINKEQSVITKWLSGTHNFTTDTLWDIEDVLNIKLMQLDDKPKEQILHYHITVQQSIDPDNFIEIEENKSEFQYWKSATAKKQSNSYIN